MEYRMYISKCMKPVIEYNNFREFIRDFYLERKTRSGFTWRDFAKAAGYSSPVFLKLVCDGKANLSEVGVERVAAAVGLAGVDLQYFRLLVGFNQEKDPQLKRKLYKELRVLAKDNSIELIGEDQYDYFDSWLNPVLREMAPQMKGASSAKLASQFVFEADSRQVKRSLELLQRTGLLEKDGDGNYHHLAGSLTTGHLDVASMAIREMHRQMGTLAVEAIDKVPMKERDISGMTIGISENAFARIQNELSEFRRKISSIVMEDQGDERVYRLNLQLFPLTKTIVKESGKSNEKEEA